MESSDNKSGVVLNHPENKYVIRHADDFEPHQLTWRSWAVVFIMAQIFTVTATGSSIAFIIRELGNPSIAGWVIQGPLLVQAALSPVVGRLSDVLDRKYLACLPTLVAFVGAVVSAKATSMNMLIGGGILIGFTLPTIAIVQAIPSEILPYKYRALSNGLGFISGTLGALIAILGGGAVVDSGVSGWRTIYWMQAAFHMTSFAGIMAFYWPPKKVREERLSWRRAIWSCDPIGSLTLIAGTTLVIMALNWAGGTYAWSNVRVVSCLVTGAVLLLVFSVYEWKGRTDGLIAHVFFEDGPNLGLSVFAFAIEGWIFFSAVNNVIPLIVLNLGWETRAWDISIRGIPISLATLFSAPFLIIWATKKKDLKRPLIFTFTLFLAGTGCYAAINEGMKQPQWGYNVILGVGQSGPLTLLTAYVQFASPPEMLSTATGLAFSARALGGALGSAVLNTIINNKLSQTYASSVGAAAAKAGLPPSSIGALLSALATGNPKAIAEVPGISNSILGATMAVSHQVFAAAYRLAWSSIIPFVVIATICCCFLTDVSNLMTEHIDATVEKVPEGKASD
ncbi:major facilitator superfamily domain-containing protein [Leptodontidium sp. 2 PMI_412]|nr:major facilitator superfamily domain-containing protein [Leptodontidium sp. 2 PMI_412]